MQLKDVIYRRKSFRNYSKEHLSPQTLLKIENFIENSRPLFPCTRFSWNIVGADKVKNVQPWRAPHNIVMFADTSTESLVNIGFVFQQTELYIQSLGLGSCWLGMGKLDSDGSEKSSNMKQVMMLAFGEYENDCFRKNEAEFKRRTLAEISDIEDTRLECARLAPSAVNSQPWYFAHDGEIIHVYCVEKYLRKIVLGNMNKIDIGIALAHIYMENKETFEFFVKEKHPDVKGYYYIGSFKI
ncbi:MAG: hypothetical protein E7484_05570 [Ruminococcaceae bacterium]|nr:hypothetical protein [Oscillospiraceae bacterium]